MSKTSWASWPAPTRSASKAAPEQADFAEALNAACAIGDDTLQRSAGQRPMPHTFTHGTSAQRMGWFERGLTARSLAVCDTFAAEKLQGAKL